MLLTQIYLCFQHRSHSWDSDLYIQLPIGRPTPAACPLSSQPRHSETNSSASLPVWSACCFLFLVRGPNSYVVLQVRIWRTILDPSSFLPLCQSVLTTLHLKVSPEGILSFPSPPHLPSWVTARDSQNHSLFPRLSLLLSFCTQQDPLKTQI